MKKLKKVVSTSVAVLCAAGACCAFTACGGGNSDELGIPAEPAGVTAVADADIDKAISKLSQLWNSDNLAVRCYYNSLNDFYISDEKSHYTKNSETKEYSSKYLYIGGENTCAEYLKKEYSYQAYETTFETQGDRNRETITEMEFEGTYVNSKSVSLISGKYTENGETQITPKTLTGYTIGTDFTDAGSAIQGILGGSSYQYGTAIELQIWNYLSDYKNYIEYGDMYFPAYFEGDWYDDNFEIKSYTCTVKMSGTALYMDYNFNYVLGEYKKTYRFVASLDGNADNKSTDIKLPEIKDEYASETFYLDCDYDKTVQDINDGKAVSMDVKGGKAATTEEFDIMIQNMTTLSRPAYVTGFTYQNGKLNLPADTYQQITALGEGKILLSIYCVYPAIGSLKMTFTVD